MKIRKENGQLENTIFSQPIPINYKTDYYDEIKCIFPMIYHFKIDFISCGANIDIKRTSILEINQFIYDILCTFLIGI